MPKITVDSYEPVGQMRKDKRGRSYRGQNIIPMLEACGLEVDGPIALPAGDYKFQDKEGLWHYVTRKASDLAQSVMDGHLATEIAKIFDEAAEGATVWFIIEGGWAEGWGGGGGVSYFKRVSADYMKSTYSLRMKGAQLDGAQISATTAGLRILSTADLRGTASMLATLVDRARRGWPTSMGLAVHSPKLRVRDPRVGRLMGLWPRLSSSLAEALLEKHESIATIVSHGIDNPDELRVKGVGTKTIAAFQEVIL